MNKNKLTKLRATAERTIAILDLIAQGKKSAEIIRILSNFEPQVERSLVDYYMKAVK